jgi:hypothetical protein
VAADGFLAVGLEDVDDEGALEPGLPRGDHRLDPELLHPPAHPVLKRLCHDGFIRRPVGKGQMDKSY